MDGNINTHGFYAREVLIYDKFHVKEYHIEENGIHMTISVITLHHAHSGGKTKELNHVQTHICVTLLHAHHGYENMELKQGFRVFLGYKHIRVTLHGVHRDT